MPEQLPTRILIVDDHPMVRQGLVFALNVMANHVQVVGEVCNGLEAVDSCAKITPHLILMDVHMPVMDGLQATQIIHALYPDIKIVLLTSFECSEKLQQEASAAGATLCLHKQMSLADFTQTLRAITGH